ncbi:permease prefix domain 1-containing protein [Streptomyces marincola]|uniref:permease prefix domain 1-containing protein n=1 Tax=Streptomyces marincola TaxID=2878388 RepID=UPI001CF32D1C|nr:permease prefix domain 1-containing protein [Streptomyces marincola]UCM90344.1 permease prefix domain 1-containing protein [Streptomyces marincola]
MVAPDGVEPVAPSEADPVDAYATALAAALHGPRAAKTRMVEEMRDGLADSVAARTAEGLPYRRAAAEAIREFGTVEELAPVCQRELTIAQTRHTARSVALTAPLLAACWALLLGAGLPGPARLVALPLVGVAALAALLGAGTLAGTGVLARRLPVPERLPLLVAWAGTIASAAMALATLALAVTAPSAAAWPLVTCAGALTVASHAVLAASARACRRCVRADTAPPRVAEPA